MSIVGLCLLQATNQLDARQHSLIPGGCSDISETEPMWHCLADTASCMSSNMHEGTIRPQVSDDMTYAEEVRAVQDSRVQQTFRSR